MNAHSTIARMQAEADDYVSSYLALVRRALRHGTWTPAEPQVIAEIARTVGLHAQADFDVLPLLPAMARAIASQAPAEARLLEGAEKEILDGAHAMLAVPNAWNCDILNGFGRTAPTAAQLLDKIKDRIAEDRRVRELNNGGQDEAAAKIRKIVEEAAARFPALGLTFGYIGGVHSWGDDRSWKVFAKLATPSCHGGCDVSFGGYDTGRLGDFLVRVEKRFGEWLLETQAKFESGAVRRVG